MDATAEDRMAEAELTDDIKIARARCKEIADRIVEVEGQVVALQDRSSQLGIARLCRLEEEVDRLWHEIYRVVACALHWRYSENDVAAWYARADDMAAKGTTISPSLIEHLVRKVKVPNAPLLARFSELVAAQKQAAIEERNRVFVAEEDLKQPQKGGYELGSTGNTVATRVAELTGIDRRDVERYLGFTHRVDQGVRRLHIFIDYDKAVTLSRALGMNPHEAGV